MAAAGAAGVPPHIEWLSMAGYGVGSIIDLSARGRAYAALPPEQRKSRWREWKERLQWGAIGLAFGVMLSIGVNRSWLADQPHWHPLSNTLAVGVVALPAIEFSRALLRALRGQSDVFAGLIIGWAQRRAGQPATATPAPPDDRLSEPGGERREGGGS